MTNGRRAARPGLAVATDGVSAPEFPFVVPLVRSRPFGEFDGDEPAATKRMRASHVLVVDGWHEFFELPSAGIVSGRRSSSKLRLGEPNESLVALERHLHSVLEKAFGETPAVASSTAIGTPGRVSREVLQLGLHKVFGCPCGGNSAASRLLAARFGDGPGDARGAERVVGQPDAVQDGALVAPQG